MLVERGCRRRLSRSVSPPTRREHPAPCWLHWRKREKPRGLHHIVVDGFHSTAHKVRLVPKSCSTRVAQELAPPLVVRRRSSPALKRVEIAPILPHPCVRRKKRKHQIFMEEKAVRFGFNRSCDLGAESEDCPHTREGVDPHAKIDDDEVWISGQVHCSSVNAASHVSLQQQFLLDDSRSNGSPQPRAA